MSVTRDILRAWTGPGAVMRDHLARGRREERALAFLMGGCLLVFVAQLPLYAREAQLGGDPVVQSAAYGFFAWLMVAPLMFYFLAMLSHWVMAALRLGIGAYQARLALFWTLLATSPAMLLYGLAAGFTGPSAATRIVGAFWLAGFGLIWFASLRASRPREEMP